MLYSKNGSIPQDHTDGTEGWIEVADKPECPDGKEVVWLNWEWIIRDPKPADEVGYQWNWNHTEKAWVNLPYGPVLDGGNVITIEPNVSIFENFTINSTLSNLSGNITL